MSGTRHPYPHLLSDMLRTESWRCSSCGVPSWMGCYLTCSPRKLGVARVLHMWWLSYFIPANNDFYYTNAFALLIYRHTHTGIYISYDSSPPPFPPLLRAPAARSAPTSLPNNSARARNLNATPATTPCASAPLCDPPSQWVVGQYRSPVATARVTECQRSGRIQA